MNGKKSKRIKKKLMRKLYSEDLKKEKFQKKRSNTKKIYAERHAIKDIYAQKEFKSIYRGRKRNNIKGLVND
jgi:hypothetical protein